MNCEADCSSKASTIARAVLHIVVLPMYSMISAVLKHGNHEKNTAISIHVQSIFGICLNLNIVNH